MKLPISEIYTAVQAEGPFRSPAVFVRVWGCNLRCRYNGESCDTPYAVIEGKYKQLVPATIIRKILNCRYKHVVFTGGEPLLYQELLEKIIGELPGNYFTEIETNGTIKLTEKLARMADQFNISLKLKNSKQPKGYSHKRINIDAIKSFPEEKSFFKFVVTSENDMNEIKKINELRPNILICLMPEGDNRKTLLKNIPKVLDLCLEHNYNFTNRDHILAYDKKRGV